MVALRRRLNTTIIYVYFSPLVSVCVLIVVVCCLRAWIIVLCCLRAWGVVLCCLRAWGVVLCCLRAWGVVLCCLRVWSVVLSAMEKPSNFDNLEQLIMWGLKNARKQIQRRFLIFLVQDTLPSPPPPLPTSTLPLSHSLPTHPSTYLHSHLDPILSPTPHLLPLLFPTPTSSSQLHSKKPSLLRMGWDPLATSRSR